MELLFRRKQNNIFFREMAAKHNKNIYTYNKNKEQEKFFF